MMQPVSINTNFTGRVRVGYDDKDRMRIAECINSMPSEEIQNSFVNKLRDLKKVLRATPDDADLFINLEYDTFSKNPNRNNEKSVLIEVRDTKQPTGRHPLGFSFMQIPEDIENISKKEFRTKINKTFNEAKERTRDSIDAGKYRPSYTNNSRTTKIFDALA